MCQRCLSVQSGQILSSGVCNVIQLQQVHWLKANAHLANPLGPIVRAGGINIEFHNSHRDAKKTKYCSVMTYPAVTGHKAQIMPLQKRPSQHHKETLPVVTLNGTTRRGQNLQFFHHLQCKSCIFDVSTAFSSPLD